MADTKKFLDADGVKVLYDLLSLQDYPNNDVLMAIINAIDETKLDKNVLKGTNELKWNGKALDNISVGWYMHLVTYDIPNGFLWVDKCTGYWNDRTDSPHTLIPFNGDGYIGLSAIQNPDSISSIWALAILKENVDVLGQNFSIPGFYLNGDPEYGEYVSPLCYEWNLLNEKADKEDLMQPNWDETDETSLAYIKNKPDLSTVSSHMSNSTIHITDEERVIWNAKLDKKKIFVGTLAEYNVAHVAGEVQIGTVVVLTDVD